MKRLSSTCAILLCLALGSACCGVPHNKTVSLFNGRDLAGWVGNTTGYRVEDGAIVWHSGGNLYTAQEYADFDFQFDFKQTAGSNNGVGLRTPLTGDAAYVGMEIQILDDNAPVYKDLHSYQYHGSIYGVVPAIKGHLKPLGEWNHEQIIARGPHIQIILNGFKIVDADINKASEKGTLDGKPHPGLKNPKGHIAFLGHTLPVSFKNITIVDLSPALGK